jgi:chemotaxis protein MotA
VKKTTLIGIAAGLGGLLVGAMMEGSKIPAFLNIPALVIVLGGTAGATLAGSSLERFKAIPSLYKRAIDGGGVDLRARLQLMVSFAEKARREGLLALDDELQHVEDEFTRKGLQLVVDGTDPELVREILENEIDGMSSRHAAAAMPFEKAGGFAPTMGILGTVMGLVHVLENLDAPETLGPAISGAFIATLYGVGSANVIFLPVANKLKLLSREEEDLRYMTLEGILAVQAGDNPRVVADKLSSFLAPEQRAADEPSPAGAGAPTQAAPDAEPLAA